MPPDTGDVAADPGDLRRWLEAERAAVVHWRRVALQREEQFAGLNSRPAVRALLGAERRIAPSWRTPALLGDGSARAPSDWRWVPALCDGLAVGVPPRRPAAPQSAVLAAARRMAIVVVGPFGSGLGGRSVAGHRRDTGGRGRRGARAALDRAIKTSTPDLVAPRPPPPSC